MLGPCTHPCSLFNGHSELLLLPVAGWDAEDRETSKVWSLCSRHSQPGWERGEMERQPGKFGSPYGRNRRGCCGGSEEVSYPGWEQGQVIHSLSSNLLPKRCWGTSDVKNRHGVCVCVCVCVAATEGFSGAVVSPLMADQEVFRLQETGTKNSPDPGWAAAVEASMPLGECKTQWLPTVNRQMEVERPAWPTHEHICRQRNQEDMVPPQGAPGLDGREMRWKDSQGNLCWGSTGWRL